MTNVWLWVGLLWSERVRMVLDRYGDRITDVSIFGWAVDLDGSLTQTFNPANLNPYRAKWPHIRWWGCFRNMDAPSGATARQIFDALRFTPATRERLATDVDQMLTTHPWLHGVDIDLEGGGDTAQSESETVFRRITQVAHRRGKKASAALPALTASGSVGGENWVRYKQLGEILDHVSVMSYDMAWNGSAPGPISPGFWMRNVYDWAASQITPTKLSMGLPAYGRAWVIHDQPTGRYRGVSGTYYAARNWLDGTWLDGPGDIDQPQMAWLAFRNDDHVPHALLGVWDWTPPQGRRTSTGYTFSRYEGKDYAVRYGRASGNPLWSLANNAVGSARAIYTIAPRPMRDIYGAWVTPRHGLNLTLELLQRTPDSAAIIDDDCRTTGQLTSTIYTRDGAWAHWRQDPDATRPYSQYRIGSAGGTLGFNRDFGSQALHIQARAQLPTAGWWGVQIGQVRAEVNNTGTLRITNNGTVIATTNVTAPGVNTTPGSGRYVLGMRIRDGHVRAYTARSTTSVPLRLEADVPAADAHGYAGVWASGAAWFDHLRLGDGWWFQPREAVEVAIGNQTWTVGRIPRTGITWDGANRFRPNTDIEESATRDATISADWTFGHIVQAPLPMDKTVSVTVRPIDVDCWLGRIFACDSQGARILYYSDAEYLARWADIATHDYGLQGIAIWTLGQEDLRFYERLAGGEYPADTVIPTG